MKMRVASKQIIKVIFSIAVLALIFVGTSNLASAQQKSGELYLIRGLFNVFSLGMDDIAKQAREQGYTAKVFNHTGWKNVANRIIKRSKDGDVSYPIVIAGHSLGANSAVSMANYLSENDVPVELVVPFDPTLKRVVQGKVNLVVNYYIPNGAANTVVGGSGFNGKIINVNVSDMNGVGHMNVEKSKELHEQFFERLDKITR